MDGTMQGQAVEDVPRDIGAVLARFGRMVRLSLRSHNLKRHGIDDDDVEQEVRIRLWTTLARNPDKELPASYVQKVVFSTVIDAVRRERVRSRDLMSGEECNAYEFPDPGRQPDTLLAHRQWTQHLRRCIGQLPYRRRVPVQLFLLGYSLQEVADARRLTLDAGSKLVRRGLADLRALLREHHSPD